eukprot:1573676-Pyramimonas_sp.AAC.1
MAHAVDEDEGEGEISDDHKLLDQYFLESLPLYSFVSFPSAPGAAVPLRVFQVISKGNADILIKTALSKPIKQRDWTLLEYEILDGGDIVEGACPAEMQVFNISGPCDSRLLSNLHVTPTLRSSVFVWSSMPPTHDGQVNLSSPTLAKPSLNLGHNAIPILCLTDALGQQGHTGVARRVVHVPDPGGAEKIDVLLLPPPPSAPGPCNGHQRCHQRAPKNSLARTAGGPEGAPGKPSREAQHVGFCQAPKRFQRGPRCPA